MSNRRDHAVNHPSRSDADPPASPVDAGGGVEVDGGIEAQEGEANEQAPEVELVGVASGAGRDFHDDGLGHGDLTIPADELGQATVDGASGGTVVLDPGRGVAKDHLAATGVMSSGISPMA